MTNGDYVHFSHITNVVQAADGTVWVDVSLHKPMELVDIFRGSLPGKHIFAPTSRTEASINSSHIMMAFETGDS
jgi:hypothetical protein